MSAAQLGRRYVTQREFIAYAKELRIAESGLEGDLEFAERLGIVTPAARVRFPDEVVRRWHHDKYPGDIVTEPIEADGPRLDAANALRNALARDLMSRTEFVGRRRHTLDAVASVHRPFISKTFPRNRFVNWTNLRALIRRGPPTTEDPRRGRSGDFYSSLDDGVRTYYHGWQIFQFAAFLRSGLSVLYDVSIDHTYHSLFDLDLPRESIRVSINVEARNELRILRESASLFDAVANFEDLCHRSLQVQGRGNFDPKTQSLSTAASKVHRARVDEIARDVMATAKLTPKAVIAFIQLQCGLWDEARSRNPASVMEAYKLGIASTIELLQAANPRYTRAVMTKRAGAAGGWVLNELFPDWVGEQRQRVVPSLRRWIVPQVAKLPAPFAFGESDVAPFCDWIEQRGFLQLYWHFQRLTEVGPFDDDIGRTAASVEVVGLASLVEQLATHVLEDRPKLTNPDAPKQTLFPKLSEILRAHDSALAVEFDRNAPSTDPVTNTRKRSLRKQLDRIRRGRPLGATTPVLKAMQRLVLIRNATLHARLSGYKRHEMQMLVEALLVAALIVWKAR